MDEIRCAVEIRQDETCGSRRGVSSVGFSSTARWPLDRRGAIRAWRAVSWPAEGVVLQRQHARGAPIMRVIAGAASMATS